MVWLILVIYSSSMVSWKWRFPVFLGGWCLVIFDLWFMILVVYESVVHAFEKVFNQCVDSKFIIVSVLNFLWLVPYQVYQLLFTPTTSSLTSTHHKTPNISPESACNAPPTAGALCGAINAAVHELCATTLVVLPRLNGSPAGVTTSASHYDSIPDKWNTNGLTLLVYTSEFRLWLVSLWVYTNGLTLWI